MSDNTGDGYVPLQDWAFLRGFALVKESRRPEGWILHCIHQFFLIQLYPLRQPMEADLRAAAASISLCLVLYIAGYCIHHHDTTRDYWK